MPTPATSALASHPYPDLAIFDYDQLVARLLGDGDVTQQVLEVFIANIGPRLDQLNEQAKDCDLPALLKSTHTIKGAAGNVSALVLHQMALDLEKAGRAADLVEIDRLTKLITTHFDSQLRPMLERQTSA